MEIIWYTALSLDGRIAAASPDGDRLDFLGSFADAASEANDFPAFLASVEAVVVGARTVRWLLAGGHGWPHPEKPTFLVSHDAALVARVAALSGPDAAGITQVSGPLDGLREQLARRGFRRVWLCGGGDVAGQLLRLDAVDTLVLTTAPVALGAGPSLFGEGGLASHRFTLASCRPFAGNGLRAVWRRDVQPFVSDPAQV